MRPVLVGLNNPYSADPACALLDRPRSATGYRIFRILKNVNPSVTERDYRAGFDRRNLTTSLNPTKSDLKAAAQEMRFEEGSTVVLLGRDVQLAFGRDDDDLLFEFFDRGVYWRSIPHPSGRCRFYNDAIQRRLVGIMLNDLYLRGQE